MSAPLRKKFEITDEVTYSRRWIVWATNEEEALEKANNEGPPNDSTFFEEQTDCTPYAAEEIVPVRTVFRIWPKRQGGDVIALMPELWHDHGHTQCTSYQHLGQHGGAYYRHVIDSTRPATAKEYAPLLKELRDRGYDVEVLKRAPKRAGGRA